MKSRCAELQKIFKIPARFPGSDPFGFALYDDMLLRLETGVERRAGRGDHQQQNESSLRDA